MMIVGKSLYLRPIRQSDMRSIYKAAQNEEISNMTGVRNTLSLREITSRYKQFIKDPARYDFAICLPETEQIIGDVSLLNVDLESKKAGFRIVIHDLSQLNKGYGTEAIQLTQDFAFKKLMLNRLELRVLSHNNKGIDICKKTGFKTEGLLRQSLYFNHQYLDDLFMAMIRTDYHHSKPSTWEAYFMTAMK